MEVTWDEPKWLANLDKHGMDFAELTVEFFESAIVYPGRAGRFVAVARLGNSSVATVIFKPLGSEAISVISMRRANRKERSLL